MFDEAYKAISTALKTKYACNEKVRNATVIELLFSTSARVSDIANLQLQHLAINPGAIMLKGKGNKERVIQVCYTKTWP